MDNSYNFLHRKDSISTVHVWSYSHQSTLCGMWNGVNNSSLYEITSTKPRGKMCVECEERIAAIAENRAVDLSSKRPPKKAIVRPEEQQYLKRWKGAKSAPSLWEKMDNDPTYASAVKSRPEGSLGNHWGIGRPHEPR